MYGAESDASKTEKGKDDINKQRWTGGKVWV